MRIDGVTDDRPAHKAGIKKGDVVVKMGSIKIVDMMSYMKGLSQFEKGNTTTVKVLREGKIVETEVTF
jgi:S1-C subfamily serine protease